MYLFLYGAEQARVEVRRLMGLLIGEGMWIARGMTPDGGKLLPPESATVSAACVTFS